MNNPTFTFYHPNARNTGAALNLSLHPAAPEDNGGWIDCRICRQRTVGDRMAKQPVFPTFDWDNAAAFKLDVDAVSQILQVLRGELEDVHDGKGIFQRDGATSRVIRFGHKIEPVPGYSLEVTESVTGGAEGSDRNFHIFLTPAESLALSEEFGGVMARLMFG